MYLLICNICNFLLIKEEVSDDECPPLPPEPEAQLPEKPTPGQMSLMAEEDARRLEGFLQTEHSRHMNIASLLASPSTTQQVSQKKYVKNRIFAPKPVKKPYLRSVLVPHPPESRETLLQNIYEIH